MRKAILLSLILSLFMGCVSKDKAALSVQDTAIYGVNTVALAIESAQTTAELLYEDHQRVVMAREGKKKPLPTQDEVKAVLAGVRAQWQPVWAAFERLRKAHGALVEVTDSKSPLAVLVAKAEELKQAQEFVADLISKYRAKYNEEKTNVDTN